MTHDELVARTNDLKLSLTKEVVEHLSTWVSGQNLIEDIIATCKGYGIDPKDTSIYIRDTYYDDKEIVMSCKIFKSDVELEKDIKDQEKRLENLKNQEYETYQKLKKQFE